VLTPILPEAVLVGPLSTMGGNAVDRPRAADDFATIKARMEELRHRRRAADDFITIRARMEELRRERDRGQASEGELRLNPLARRHRTER